MMYVPVTGGLFRLLVGWGFDGHEHLIDCAPKRLKRQRHLVKSDLGRGSALAHTIPSIHAMPSVPIEAAATCECPHFSVAGTCTIVKH